MIIIFLHFPHEKRARGTPDYTGFHVTARPLFPGASAAPAIPKIPGRSAFLSSLGRGCRLLGARLFGDLEGIIWADQFLGLSCRELSPLKMLKAEVHEMWRHHGHDQVHPDLLQRFIQIRVAHTLEDSDIEKKIIKQLSSVQNPFLIPFYWLFNKDSPIGFNMMGSIIPN